MSKANTAIAAIGSAPSANRAHRVTTFIAQARQASTAAEIASAIGDAEQLAGVVRAELADAKEGWGAKLLDSSADEREEHDRLVRALSHEAEQLAAIVLTLRTRLTAAEDREHESLVQAQIRRGVELVESSKRHMDTYETLARKVAGELEAIRAEAAEFDRIERFVESAGRRNDLFEATGGYPGRTKESGDLYADDAVLLPSVSERHTIWPAWRGRPE